MPSSTDPASWPKPAYGQVWQWNDNQAMLLAHSDGLGKWSVLYLIINGQPPLTMKLTGEWFGLYSHRQPIAGFTYIEG